MNQAHREAISNLRVPAGFELEFVRTRDLDGLPPRWMSFIESSPDLTAYHLLPLMQFAESQKGWGGYVLGGRDGQPYFALPIHPSAAGFVTTNYSGVLFGEGNSRQLARRARSFVEFLDANPKFALLQTQSAQARGWSDFGRSSAIASVISSAQRARVVPCFTRVVDLSAVEPTIIDSKNVFDCAESAGLLASFDSDIRNQIRSGIRKGLQIEVFELKDEGRRTAFFDQMHPLHVESWSRGGLTPHSRSYVEAQSKAVVDTDGASNVGIIVRNGNDEVAAVDAHIFEQSAIYWSGATTLEGQRVGAGPLALMTAMVAARAAGAHSFEVGRFRPQDDNPKEVAISAYKSQFGGAISPVLDVEIASRAARLRLSVRKVLAPPAKRILGR